MVVSRFAIHMSSFVVKGRGLRIASPTSYAVDTTYSCPTLDL